MFSELSINQQHIAITLHVFQTCNGGVSVHILNTPGGTVLQMMTEDVAATINAVAQKCRPEWLILKPASLQTIVKLELQEHLLNTFVLFETHTNVCKFDVLYTGYKFYKINVITWYAANEIDFEWNCCILESYLFIWNHILAYGMLPFGWKPPSLVFLNLFCNYIISMYFCSTLCRYVLYYGKLIAFGSLFTSVLCMTSLCLNTFDFFLCLISPAK